MQVKLRELNWIKWSFMLKQNNQKNNKKKETILN